VPALAECLTLNKADFIRAGARGATYLAYRKAIQEAVTQQLAGWGDAPAADERTRRRAARPVERDLDVEPFAPQARRDRGCDRLFVFDDDDPAGRGRGPCGWH
jgi:hypothetical protein